MIKIIFIYFCYNALINFKVRLFMSKKHESMHEIAFETMQGILVITFWFLILFGAAYFLEYILPIFTWKSLVVISAYVVKYILLAVDLYLFGNAIIAEVQVSMKKINNYKKENL